MLAGFGQAHRDNPVSIALSQLLPIKNPLGAMPSGSTSLQPGTLFQPIIVMIHRMFCLICCGLMGSLLAQDGEITDWQFAQREMGGIWEVWRDVAYERDIWSTVQVPHCVNAYDAVDPDRKYYQGESWYKTALTIDNPYPEGRTLLHCEGVGQKATLYVYQTKAGFHTGGYDEFTFDLTDAVAAYQVDETAFTRQAYGEKVPLALCADNTRDLNSIPSDLSDFNLYGGMYRKVHLRYVPAISLAQLHVASQVDLGQKTARLQVKTKLYNPANHVEDLRYRLKIFDPAGKVIGEKTQTTQLSAAGEFSLTLEDPALWSPASPALYRCEVTLESTYGTQTLAEPFGLRSFSFEKKGPFYLNGQRLLLRGTHRHEDHAGVGQAMHDAQMREEFRLMKEMGVNFIRLGHYQQSELVLDLCDSLGILVWEEIPWCRAGADAEGQRQAARATLRSLIAQHYNHPSVIIWGLGNEHDWRGEREHLDTVAIRNLMAELNDLAHVLDPSRKTAIRRCNFAKDLVDVYSPSIWAGWYRGIFTEYRNVSRQEMEEVDHFLHVEWGASHHALRHAEDPDQGIEAIGRMGRADEREGDFLLEGGDPRVSKDGDWSTTYACNLIDWHLKEQENMPWLTGTAYWPFKDFSTPLRPENPIPYVNQKGVLERDFTKKESYYVFQSYWTETPMVHIYGSTWPVRWGEAEEEKLLKVYSNCESVELILNGQSLGRKQRDSQDYPAAGLRWRTPLRPGENEVIARGQRGEQAVLDTLVFTYQTDQWGLPDHLTLRPIAQRGDSVLLEARLFDADSVLCLDASDFVRFGLVGAAQLLDNQGTSVGSRRIGLANGVARIWLRRQGGPAVASVELVPHVEKETPRMALPPAFLAI